MNELELAARVLLATVKAGGDIDLTGLEAALEPDSTPLIRFSKDDPSFFISGALEGAQGLRVTFGREAVGLMPEGFPGLCLSYPAAFALRDLLVEEAELAYDIEAARRRAEERICPICQGELDPETEGPECDDTGCPGRYDGEPIEA